MCLSNTLYHLPFTRSHSEAATVPHNPMSILQVAHGAGTPKRAHRYREKQEGLTVTPPQLRFIGLLQCVHSQSVPGGNLSLRSRFCFSGCAPAHVFQLHAQRATDALQNIHHLLCGGISYCKIREEVVQKSSLRQPEIISLSPRKSQVTSPSGFISHSQQVRTRRRKRYIWKSSHCHQTTSFLFYLLLGFFPPVFLPSF